MVSSQDLKQIDYNLKSIRDYRKGRSTQLQMSGKYTFDFLDRSESTPQPQKGLKTVFQRQRTVEDGYLPTRQFRPARQNPARIYAELKSQKVQNKAFLPPIIIQRRGEVLKLSDADLDQQMKTRQNQKFQLVVDDD